MSRLITKTYSHIYIYMLISTAVLEESVVRSATFSFQRESTGEIVCGEGIRIAKNHNGTPATS